ncbi:MAG: carbohydrate binding family 9 domain-containing protein [Proteobacteria bacterium]|nr:carbohydrate binding family 9 domain-containing protein [Pseudomonadota bacterium]
MSWSKSSGIIGVLCGLSIVVLSTFVGTTAAATSDNSSPGSVRSTSAARRVGTITIDGRLDEAAWKAAPSASGFWQRYPREGDPPNHETEFRVLYDNEAVYIGVFCHESEPGKIRRTLTRRDEESPSDWIEVGIDSYRDKRTAFMFAVNPAGVQRDTLVFNDTEKDDSWDAVWTASADVNKIGWTAEFRIPLSQLRFSPASEQQWGFQVIRNVAHSNEYTVWSPWPKSKPQMVSLFGSVKGIKDINPPRRMEVLPYVVSGVTMSDGDETMDGNAGLDFEYGLGNNFTLSGTINPDFGQVEADPSQVNLSADESYFAEKRPFFLEGIDIFKFSLGQGDGGNEQLFYSRRIGLEATIYGAAKLSGKTASGWSIGVLDAVTAEESDEENQVIEPLTNYGLLRVKKDLNGGRTTIGGVVTAVNRDLDGTGLESELHDRAYAGGLQLNHRFAGDRYDLNLRLVGSYVHGSAEAITLTQESSQRYFQREDADHVEVDPDRTSLKGAGLVWSTGKSGGEHWRFAMGGNIRSPGLEINDLGFQNTADNMEQWLWGQYRDDDPGEYLQNYGVNLNAWMFGNTSPELAGIGGNMNGHLTLRNYWDAWAGFSANKRYWNHKILRGGPALRGLDSMSFWLGGASDSRRSLRGRMGMDFGGRPESGTWWTGASAELIVQARSNLDIRIGPRISRYVSNEQYVDETPDAESGAPRYILARMEQTTVGVTLRMNYTFMPTLSVQLYAQPFISTGAYRNYKAVTNPRANRYDDRFEMFDPAQATDFELPDFNFRQLNSNLVLRWEYLPGSALFLVWSHGRLNEDTHGRFELGNELDALTDEPGEHVFLLKLNYWYAL